MEATQSLIHATAEVSPDAQIGSGTKIWHQAHVREGVVIGKNCIIGKDVYVDFDVVIGNNVKIQNSAMIYHGVTIEDGVFVGPQACLTNDRTPRAITPNGLIKASDDWTVEPLLIRYGASIGAGAIVIPPVTIGRFAMVAAGSVVTKNVPDYGLAIGVPAHVVGYVCPCGNRLEKLEEIWRCPVCEWILDPVDDAL
jgi:UDP-2-acetamido-3-amino-2,3-dideoxy-glucuronate N-acetyltransferase